MANFFFPDIGTELDLLTEIAARRQRYSTIKQSISPGFAATASTVARNNPTLPGSIIVGGAELGLGPEDPFYQEAEKRVSEQNQSIWSGVWDSIFNAGKGTVRNVLAGFTTLWEETVPPLTRTLYKAGQEADTGGQFGAIAAIGRGLNPVIFSQQIAEDIDTGQSEWGKSIGIKAIRESIAGRPVNLGTGFLPQSDPNSAGALISQESEQERNALQLAPGTSVSPGTLLARTILEPGSVEFDNLSGAIDFAAQIFLDPANKLGGGYSKLRKANKGFGQNANLLPRISEAAHKVGLISSRRNSIFSPTAEKWIHSRQGQALARNLAEDTSISSIKNKLKINDHRLLADFTRARTVNDVNRLLSKNLGSTIRQKPVATGLISTALNLPTPGQALGRGLSAVTGGNLGQNLGTYGFAPTVGYSVKQSRLGRLLADRPGMVIDLEDRNQIVADMDDFLINLNLPADRRDAYLNIFSNFLPNNFIARGEFIEKNAKRAVKEGLKDSGIEPDFLKTIIDEVSFSNKNLGDLFVDNSGIPGYVSPVTPSPGSVLAAIQHAPSHLMSDVASATVSLPDPRVLRKGASKVAKYMRIAKISRPDLQPRAFVKVLEKGNQYWRAFALIRGAWTARVLLEEQGRIATAGLASGLNRPIEYLTILMGSKLPKGKSLDTFLGKPWEALDEFAAAQTRSGGGWANDPIEYARRTKEYKVTDDDAFDAWVEEISRMASDDITRQAINDPQNVHEWYWSGAGKQLREQQIKDGRFDTAALKTRDGADNYIDSVIARAMHMTGGEFQFGDTGYRIIRPGDSDLLSLMGSGQLSTMRKGGRRELNITMANFINAMPQRFGGLERRAVVGPETESKLINILFDYLGSKPMNYLTRSPTFKQYAYENIATYLPHADDAVKAQMRAILPTLNLTSSIKRKINLALDTSLPGGGPDVIDNFADLENMALASALEDTKNLLYDVAKKSNLADALRIISPFFEAWKEMWSIWPSLIRDNPNVLRKGQMLFEGARENGFFIPDENGEGEHFVIPGADWLLGAVSGAATGGNAAPFSMNQEGIQVGGYAQATASVQGLNMVTSSWLPGLGPMASIPLSHMLEVLSVPSTSGVDKVLLPYGRSYVSSPDEAFQSLAPTWIRRLGEATDSDDPDIQRAQANSMVNVMRHMLMSGKVNPSDQQQLLEQSAQGAKWLGILRAGATFFLPAPPKIEWVRQIDEDTFTHTAMTAAYYDILEAYDGDFDLANQEFLSRFGADPALFSTATSRANRPMGTEENSFKFYNENKDLFQVGKFPGTAYYASPDDGQSEMSWDAWRERYASGASETLSAEEWLLVLQNKQGWDQYYKVMADAEAKGYDLDSEAGRAFKADYKNYLRELYPHFGFDEPGVPQNVSFEQQLHELSLWETEPRLANTEAGKGVVEYMNKREEALEVLKSRGFTTLSSDAAAPLRAYLRDTGNYLVEQYPQFRYIFTRVLSRELEE